MAQPQRSSGMFGLVPMTEDFSLDQPEVNLDDTDEKRKKRLSKSKQWKEAVALLERRKALYQKQLPGSPDFRSMSQTDAAYYGAIANCVIEEIEFWVTAIEGIM